MNALGFPDNCFFNCSVASIVPQRREMERKKRKERRSETRWTQRLPPNPSSPPLPLPLPGNWLARSMMSPKTQGKKGKLLSKGKARKRGRKLRRRRNISLVDCARENADAFAMRGSSPSSKIKLQFVYVTGFTQMEKCLQLVENCEG